ncbi:PAS domain S-box protein [Bradyrhizobium sp. C-145]|uniref:PAS domain S-box protein n=1 Tax=Bradyrhizobium sp. C-145 TaxID=574727 RepID=UPI00201B78BB|nr:PAS domain S-box protein [Bradyrhizobium sp. C-145]UQR62396.1 PAS domain S-box protein [Bradyrhizobium sp. C-145]
MNDDKSTEVMNGPADLADAVLGTVSDAIIAADRAGVIKFWNPGAVRIFGFTAEEALGHSLDLIIPKNLRARHWKGYYRVMETGESRYDHDDLLSVPGVTKDGRRISVEFTVLLLRDEMEKPIGIAAIIRDVTRRFEEI